MDPRGYVPFSTQESAETYLMALPFPYAGRTVRTLTGWAVSYHRAERIASTEASRQRRARNRAISRRAQRSLKSAPTA